MPSWSAVRARLQVGRPGRRGPRSRRRRRRRPDATRRGRRRERPALRRQVVQRRADGGRAAHGDTAARERRDAVGVVRHAGRQLTRTRGEVGRAGRGLVGAVGQGLGPALEVPGARVERLALGPEAGRLRRHRLETAGQRRRPGRDAGRAGRHALGAGREGVGLGRQVPGLRRQRAEPSGQLRGTVGQLPGPVRGTLRALSRGPGRPSPACWTRPPASARRSRARPFRPMPRRPCR